LTPKENPNRVSPNLRTTGLDSKYRVEVSDTSIGIAPEEQEKIFSEFHQEVRKGSTFWFTLPRDGVLGEEQGEED